MTAICSAGDARAVTLNAPSDFEHDTTGEPSFDGWSAVDGMVSKWHDPGGDHVLNYLSNGTFHFGTSQSDFRGDYASAGVTTLQFDAKHTGGFGDDVHLRAYLYSDNNNPQWYDEPNGISEDGIFIRSNAFSPWRTYSISLEPNDLTPINGTTTDLLSDVTHIGLRHDPLGSGSGQGVYVLFDNIVLLGAAVPGDFDSDGDVDGVDFLNWQRNPNVGSLSNWEANYGLSLIANSAAVPEPGVLVLAFAALFFGSEILHR